MTQGDCGLVVDGELPQLRGRLLEGKKLELARWPMTSYDYGLVSLLWG